MRILCIGQNAFGRAEGYARGRGREREGKRERQREQFGGIDN